MPAPETETLGALIHYLRVYDDEYLLDKTFGTKPNELEGLTLLTTAMSQYHRVKGPRFNRPHDFHEGVSGCSRTAGSRKCGFNTL